MPVLLSSNRKKLVVLQWLRANGCPWDTTTLLAAAIEGNDIVTLQWAEANGCPLAMEA